MAEIDREIFQCGMENTKRIFKNPDKADEYNRDFKENLRKLENEKSNLLKVNGISADYNKYKYKCENCSDTGGVAMIKTAKNVSALNRNL